METRVAVLAIIVRDTASVPALNELLHQYAPYIIGLSLIHIWRS